jgi:hypothetical protein
MDEKDEARDVTVDLRGFDVTVYVQGIEVNVSPDAFHIYAGHYYKCKQDFKPPDDYVSSLPYFLLCRAIELELKARLLQYWRQSHVKRDFGHRLLDVYNFSIRCGFAGKIPALAPDARADALHGGAEVVGGDGGVNSQTGKVIPATARRVEPRGAPAFYRFVTECLLSFNLRLGSA